MALFTRSALVKKWRAWKAKNPEFPLTVNANGFWSKVVRGKVYYFGTLDQKDEALELWDRKASYLRAGKIPPTPAGCLGGGGQYRVVGCDDDLPKAQSIAVSKAQPLALLFALEGRRWRQVAYNRQRFIEHCRDASELPPGWIFGPSYIAELESCCRSRQQQIRFLESALVAMESRRDRAIARGDALERQAKYWARKVRSQWAATGTVHEFFHAAESAGEILPE